MVPGSLTDTTCLSPSPQPTKSPEGEFILNVGARGEGTDGTADPKTDQIGGKARLLWCISSVE